MKQYLALLVLLSAILDVSARPYMFKRLGVENGLSSNYVRDMVCDGKGCIWIATESGLNYFDGRSFTVYRTNNSAIVGNELNTLLYDREENTLWIGSQRDGISVFDCTTYNFHNYTSENGLATNDVTCLSHAADGGVWVTHYYVGIEHYDSKTKQFRLLSDEGNIKGLKTPNWCAVEDGKGNLYVGHVFDGMSIINLKDSIVRNYRNDPASPGSIPGNAVYSICIDRQKNVWAGTDQGLALYNPQTDSFLCFKHNDNDPFSLITDHVQHIGEMNDGTLWIATGNGGISIFDRNSAMFMDPEKVKFRNIISTDSNMFPSGDIQSFLQDSFGNIWIGNFDYGIDFISHTQPLFQMLPYADAVKNKPVWGIFSDGEQIWAGGKNEIILFRDNQMEAAIDISDYTSNPHNQVIVIKKDRQGSIWIGLYGEGILKYNEQNNRFTRIELKSTDFITLFEDTDGKMLAGTNMGISSYQNGMFVNEEQINNQLNDRNVYCILRDRQGKLWVGTFGKGIFVFDADNRLVSHIEVVNGFCSNAILHFYMDSKGSIWAATRNGIACFINTAKPDDFELYGDPEGIENSHVLAIQEDLNGNIWLSTDNGISFFDKENRKFDNYNYRDGISMENFATASACISPDGMIYFGSLGGVCYFDPKDFVETRRVAPVHILDCKILNEQIESRQEGFFVPIEQGTVSLPYTQNSFCISFTVPDYSQNQQVEYAYMVEELEKIWYDTQGENQVTFRNISSGEYTFRVKARLKNGEWDESHIATVTVIISPPLWFAWYAKMFYAFVICFLIYLWMRFYRRKLNLEHSLKLAEINSLNEQELNQERLRFYTNITHELRTPLTLILGPLEDLRSDSNLPPQYSNKIKIIHDSAVRLLNLINRILEFRKTETQNCRLTVTKGDLRNLVMEIGLRYKELNRNDKVRFTVNIETDKTVLYFDADVITTILNNLLSNAVKYTSEGEIRLTLSSVTEQESEYTEISVRDTGYGISPQDLPRIFDRYYQAKGKHQASGTGIGLALVKSLTDLHQGDIHVESVEGKGSVFSFRILTKNTYPDALHKDAKKTAPAQEAYREEEDADSCSLILVAEDDDDIREYIAASFASNSNRVITATNGREALELAQKYIPNIIISDVMMPAMDGIEFCRSVKKDVRTSHIPVILLTAKDTILDKEEGYESGADSYLTKPFSAKLLTSRVRNLLESRRKLAQQITANAKKISQDRDADNAMKLSKPDKDFLTDVTRVIEENLCSDKLDIDFVSDKMHMSHSTFYRKVKGLTGVSASEFIRKIRLKNSLQLLMSGKYNI
jgi:signal transduction histidine kinase/ligand-binding sensor domain-containing protein/DNA-binding NarL/FixJ family response regulator